MKSRKSVPSLVRSLPPVTVSLRREEARHAAVETGRSRLVIIGAVFALAFLAIAGRLTNLAFLQSGDGIAAAVPDDAVVAVLRPEIVDRNGVLLATNLRTASLYANPHLVLDPADAADRVARILPDVDRQELFDLLTSSKRFAWIKRSLTPRQQYAVNALGIPGLAFVDEERRVYPQGDLVAHIVGYTGVDNRGLAGIEKHIDDRLDAAAANGGVQPPLRLSLDVRVQHAVRDALSHAMTEFEAIGAAGLVLDARSGEVLAAVSLPDFDPHQAGRASADARFSRATLGVYEMGSTFKIFTTAMALDAGTVDMSGGYDATEPIRIARFTISDDHPKNRWLSVPEIFIYSSNIGAAKMALDVGPERQRDFLRRVGLLERSAVEVPEIGAPMAPDQWRKINTMTIAYGHGVAVTPLQMTAAVSSLVNGGTRVSPTFIARPGDPVPAGDRVISQRTSDALRALMRRNVEEGTGTKAEAPGYQVGGKTGTAEKAGAGGYQRRALLSSFIGAFPMNDPHYVVLAMLDEPRGNKKTFGYATAGWTAAPTVGRIVERIAPLLSVVPETREGEDKPNGLLVKVNGEGRRIAAF